MISPEALGRDRRLGAGQLRIAADTAPDLRLQPCNRRLHVRS
jgi:hypothetical protein